MTLSPFSRALSLALAAAALTAPAHAAAPHLVANSPDTKDGYRSWPHEIRLTFDQPVSSTGLQASLIDPDGRRIPLKAPVTTSRGAVFATALTDPPVPGPYMLSWQARSAGGDESKGDFTFFVQ
jgi:methionine-rich copper-binding protein CopC